jgi:hypothetical protein
MKVLPRNGQEENLNLQEDKAVNARNSLRGSHPPASYAGGQLATIETNIR